MLVWQKTLNMQQVKELLLGWHLIGYQLMATTLPQHYEDLIHNLYLTWWLYIKWNNFHHPPPFTCKIVAPVFDWQVAIQYNGKAAVNSEAVTNNVRKALNINYTYSKSMGLLIMLTERQHWKISWFLFYGIDFFQSLPGYSLLIFPMRNCCGSDKRIGAFCCRI